MKNTSFKNVTQLFDWIFIQMIFLPATCFVLQIRILGNKSSRLYIFENSMHNEYFYKNAQLWRR